MVIIMNSNNGLPKKIVYDKKLNTRQIDLLNSQYQKILQISKEKFCNNQLYLTKNREVYLPKDALIHVTNFSIERVKSISKNGILAPDLLGKSKPKTTYYCADFYRIKDDILVTNCNNSCVNFDSEENIAFVINPCSKIGGLVYYDLLNGKFKNNSIINSIIENDNSVANSNYSAILAGIPANAISGIILGSKIVLNTQSVKLLENLFPNAYLITRNGDILRDRSNLVKIEDYEDISLKQCQEHIRYVEIQRKNAALQRANAKLRKNISLILNNIKKILPPFEQAKLLISIGHTKIPLALLENLTLEEKKELGIKENYS